MDEQRQDRRARLFLAARLRAGHGVRQVTIRNLSATGAMLELAEPPPKETEVQLSRSDLSVSGKIAWSEAGACGVKFDGPIDLPRWLPSTGQQRVDEDLAAIRSGRPRRVTADASVAKDADVLPRVAEELAFVERTLEVLGETLADDRYVTARHAITLQSLDVAMQTLRHLAGVLKADDRAAAIQEIGMVELRRRLMRKPI